LHLRTPIVHRKLKCNVREQYIIKILFRWDSGDDERVSPWDLERVPDDLGAYL